MPKKATTARSGAQRNKAKAQKSFEVVRQNAEDQERTENVQAEAAPISALDTFASVPSMPTKSTRRAAVRASVATQEVETENIAATPEITPEVGIVPTPLEKRNTVQDVGIVPTSPAKGNSASARLAARRGQKLQQRTPATLVTAEHYSYVRRDLIIIAMLASIMFIAIIVLYFTIGRG